MKRERWQSLIALVLITVASILLGLLVSGCSKDCPTCPKVEETKHYKGWLYYGERSAFYSYDVYKVDMETDSIIDSLHSPVGVAGDLKPSAVIQASTDGRYLAVLWVPWDFVDSKLVIYDAQTLAVIKEIPERLAPFFDTEHNLLFGAYGGQTGHFISVFQIPSFDLIRVDSVGNWGMDVLDTKHYLAYGTADNTSWTHEYPDGFYAYNYSTKEMRRVPISEHTGDTVNVFGFCLSRDGSRVFFHGLSSWLSNFGFVGCADVATGEIQWWLPTLGYFGQVALSLDEKELYVTNPGYPDYLNPGTIYIHDARTGRYLEGISLYGYNPNPSGATGGEDVVFSPTGERAYVCGTPYGDGYGGSLLTIDTKTREITKIFRPDWQSVPHSPRIVPKR
jgi:hypothetical protein